MLGIVLDLPLTVDITVTLQTNEGTATGIKLSVRYMVNNIPLELYIIIMHK